MLWGSGPLFPLSLMLLGGALFWTGVVPRSHALLTAAAGAAFSLSRISRIELVAHGVDDLLLLVASAWLAALMLGSVRGRFRHSSYSRNFS